MRQLLFLVIPALFLCAAFSACMKTRSVVPAGMPENVYKDNATFLSALSQTVPGAEKRFLVRKKNLLFGLFYVPKKDKYIVSIVHARLPDNLPVAGGELYGWSLNSIKTGREAWQPGNTILVNYTVYDQEIHWSGHWFKKTTTQQNYDLDLGEWAGLDVPESDIQITGHTNFSDGDLYTFSAFVDPKTMVWTPKITITPAPPVRLPPDFK